MVEEQEGWTTDRRTFLGGLVAGALPLIPDAGVTASAASPDGESTPPAFPGLITREKEPTNLEFPFPTLGSHVTPTNRFFVRNHFAVPKIDATRWRLKVEGEVKNELELSLEDLRKFTPTTLSATIECAGNSRAFLVPKAKGILWELGAVGNAEWTGVRLADVLEKAGNKGGVAEVILSGADQGEIGEEPKTPGPIHFERSLPLDKARRPEVLLAYQMNGKDLPPEHGFPLRVVVPGWYGMASVKWLTRISLTAAPFQGYWQTISYSYWKRDRGRPILTPVTEIQVKAQVARPSLHEAVPAGEAYRVFGAAWAGESEVVKVEVSVDGGRSWAEAKLLGKQVPFTWRQWEYSWKVPKEPGRYTVMARATDKRGRTQPENHDVDRRAYMICHVLPVEVLVR